jgi:RNA polymerase sigma factor (sigma-70 family)
MFLGYAIAEYWKVIGRKYGNQHIDDYIDKIEDGVLKSIKNFEGSEREVFCAYVNECIRNFAKKFLRDNIKPKYKIISLDERFGVVGVCSYFLCNRNTEELVVRKMTTEALIFEHMILGLSAAEKDAILRRMKDVETVEEYAERVACEENTIRARESKAIKKMREKAKAKGLKDLYHL